jgi:hypothetical protein
MRVTKVDACGAPVPGAKSAVVSDGFVSVALTANTDQGTAISVSNANGKTCIQDTPAPQFLGYSVEVQFCGVDPELFGLMTGQAVVFDPANPGDAVGIRVSTGVDLDAQGFALEVWSTVPGQACSGGEQAYGYFLLPFLKGGVIGDFTIANDAINFTVSNAQTKDGSSWGVGPYDVTRDDSGDAGPLNTAITEDDHLHLERVTVAPPTSACGAIPLGTVATGATAGIPGTYTPANSYAPDALADMDSVTASPATLWTAGQYVVLGDGSHAYWTGTAWAAGESPGT